jgi:hypothetical protein
MHPKDYLYAIPLSVGCAVICEHCQATVAVTFTPDDAAKIIATHTCPTTSSTRSPEEVGR